MAVNTYHRKRPCGHQPLPPHRILKQYCSWSSHRAQQERLLPRGPSICTQLRMSVYLPDLLRWCVIWLPLGKGLTEAFIMSQGSPQPALGGGSLGDTWGRHRTGVSPLARSET